VDLVRHYSNRSDLLTRLAEACRLAGEPEAHEQRVTDLTVPARPVGAWQIRDRLMDAEVEALIADFLAGTSKRELAERYGISFGGVKHFLRRHGVRRTS
jgi:hypothetical protein